MATKFSFRAEQHFECRDCPGRCCSLPWSAPISDREKAKLLAEPWISDRVGQTGLEVIRRGVLPLREVDGRLRCAFIEDDHLCSMQSEFGHDYLPRTCQVYPFGFVQNEKKEVVVHLSRLCPSVRDDVGKPLKSQLRAKLKQQGGAERMADKMGTLEGTVLSRPQYLRVAEGWRSELQDNASPARRVAHLYDWTLAFDRAIPDTRRAESSAVSTGLGHAADCEEDPLMPRSRSSFHARVCFAHLLGNLCYPARVRQQHRLDPPAAWRLLGLRALANKLAWMLEWGTVDMLLMPGPLPLRRVRSVGRWLAGDLGVSVREYLCDAVGRRQIFTEPRHLLALVVDMGLAVALISRFARCRAAADGRGEVTHEDVREAIGVGDFLVLGHAAGSQQGVVLDNLRQILISNRDAFRSLLATEA